MNTFTYARASSIEEALRERALDPRADFLAGGTNLIDHLRLGIERPDRLIDIRRLGIDQIEETDNGIRIGAGVTNTALAFNPLVKERLPALSQAILSGASPQLRNVATVGGNLLQRTRCAYFRDGISPCNKRDPGSGCFALDGVNRGHALLGTTDKCIATHPSDMCVALVAYEAVIVSRSLSGERRIPICEFFIPYGEDPARENVLEPGELVLAIEIPVEPWFTRSTYVKARDRASFEFALASAAVALDVSDGAVRNCRIALGGIATKPWRAAKAEQALQGKALTEEAFRAAAEAELGQTQPQKDNGFKVELCQRVMVKAFREVM